MINDEYYMTATDYAVYFNSWIDMQFSKLVHWCVVDMNYIKKYIISIEIVHERNMQYYKKTLYFPK